MKSLAQMQAEVLVVNKNNGWFDEDRSFGDDIALLHSEVSEAFEEYRAHGLEDTTVNSSKYHEYDEYEQTAAGRPKGFFCKLCGNGKDNIYHGLPKPEGVGSELADILIRLLDTCHRTGIDLEAEYNRKIKYNETRGYRHGGKRV